MLETRKTVWIIRFVLVLGVILAFIFFGFLCLIFHSRPVMAILNFWMAITLVIVISWIFANRNN